MKPLRIKVLGGGGEVGRTAIVLSEDSCRKVLLDYGITFDEQGLPVFPGHVRPIDLACIIISHAHLDHIGAAPGLYVTSRPTLVTTRPTLEIGNLLIKDFLKISGYYADYEEGEVTMMIESSKTINYGEEIEIEGYSIIMTSAGHILGSSLTYITTPSGHRILYTGDVNTIQTWTLTKAELWPYKIDTIIIESTYGAVDHPPRHLVEHKLVEAIEEVLDRGGTVLIPAFSVGRSQEVISILAAEMPGIPVYLDGMARDMTELYLRYEKFLRDPAMFRRAVENTRFVKGWEERRKIWKKPCVIVASAGMLKGGPSLYYLKKLADDPKNAVFLVSYQSPDSPGHKVLEDGYIEDLGIEVKARLQWFDLSSHAGKSGLLEIIYHYKNDLKNIVIVHGDDSSREALAKYIKEKISEDINIYMPHNGDEIVLRD